MFKSSTKGHIRKVHVVVVQGRQRNIPKSVPQVQSFCFGYFSFFDVAAAVDVVVVA